MHGIREEEAGWLGKFFIFVKIPKFLTYELFPSYCGRMLGAVCVRDDRGDGRACRSCFRFSGIHRHGDDGQAVAAEADGVAQLAAGQVKLFSRRSLTSTCDGTCYFQRSVSG